MGRPTLLPASIKALLVLTALLFDTSHAQLPPVVDGRFRLRPEGLISETDLLGLRSITYHSLRYEPICGTFSGKGLQFYSQDFDVADRCPSAIKAFLQTEDTVAIYDTAGVKLDSSAVIGKQEACMCFTLGTPSGSQGGHFCFYFDPEGRVERAYNSASNFMAPPQPYNAYLASSFRLPLDEPKEPLPQCTDSDVSALAASWSATAVGVATKTNKPASGTPLHTSTSFSTIVSTKPNGEVVTTAEPTIIVYAPKDDDSGPLSRSDKIAIGLGLGVGIPSIAIAVWGVIAMLRKNKSSQTGQQPQALVELHTGASKQTTASTWSHGGQQPYTAVSTNPQYQNQGYYQGQNQPYGQPYGTGYNQYNAPYR